MKQKTDIAIIGAGLSGLSLAHFLVQRGLSCTLIESDNQFGGYIRTERQQGFLVEWAANGFLAKSVESDSNESIAKVIHDIGMHSAVIGASDTCKKRYIYKNSKLNEVPTKPPKLLTTRLLTAKGKLRALCEPFIGKHVDRHESLASFVERRFGKEVLQYFIDPMVRGIFAGNPEQLHAHSAFPKIVELEWRYGSLIKAMRKSGSLKKPRHLYSFQEGMGSFVNKIGERLEKSDLTAILMRTEVEEIQRHARGEYCLHLKHHGNQARLYCNHVVLATNVSAAAKLIRDLNPRHSEVVDSFPTAPLVSATVGFRNADIPRPLDGYGFLVPSVEPLRMLGAIWSSSLFDNRSPENTSALRCMLGGVDHPEVVQWTDEEIMNVLKRELRHTLGISRAPIFTNILRYKKAIPQYTQEHIARVAAIEQCEQINPGLYFTGNYIDGLSVSRCVERAEDLAKKLEHAVKNERKETWKESSLSVPAPPA